MAFNTLVVNSSGVELSYIDSGPPSKSPYTTIFAVHGMCFSNLIFAKVQFEALANGVRFVAINRRSFPGSTPFSPTELDIIMKGGDDQQRDVEIAARGHEIACFISNFSRKQNLPPISSDGKTGGIVLLGWSVGNALSLAAIASAHSLPDDVRSHIASYIRALIVYEPAPIVLGLPTPEQNWAPLIDTSIPENLRLPAFGQWVTAYFDHEDISKRDLSTLSWVLPATDQIPTIFNIPSSKLKEMECYGAEASSDLPFLFHFANQLKSSYRKTFYDPETIKLFPKLNITFLCGDRTCAFGLAGLWAVQNDEKENGRKNPITYKMIHGANHFLHWDDPKKAFEVFMACA